MNRYLTDGTNYVWGSGDEYGKLLFLTGSGNLNLILAAMSDVFGTEVISEHEPQFWGYKTMEEWEQAKRTE